MKLLLIFLLILSALFAASQIYTSMAKKKTDEQEYTVIRTEENLEIRFYPSVTMASINSTATSYRELGSSGFNKLAAFIFGKNSSNLKIAMTSPVHMAITDSSSKMSFVMPPEYNKDNLPQPNNPDVKIETTNDQYVAAITFSGFASDKKIKEYTAKLESALKQNAISYYDTFRVLGYNPPFQLFSRRNEIIVNVFPR